jgi:predicted amidohydrolase
MIPFLEWVARAIENQCYVIAAAQYGQHNEKRQSYGHSLSVDPWGKLITDAGGYDSHGSASPSLTVPSVTYCDIDQGLLEEVRERMPLYRPTFSF